MLKFALVTRDRVTCSGTGACSLSSVHGFFRCPVEGSLIPYSRLHDGVCDCCSGADERGTLVAAATAECADVCTHWADRWGAVLARVRAVCHARCDTDVRCVVPFDWSRRSAKLTAEASTHDTGAQVRRWRSVE